MHFLHLLHDAIGIGVSRIIIADENLCKFTRAWNFATAIDRDLPTNIYKTLLISSVESDVVIFSHISDKKKFLEETDISPSWTYISKTTW